MGEERLPFSEFTTRDLPATRQFAAWRAANRVMFDVLSPGEQEPAAFSAEARTWQAHGLTTVSRATLH